MARTRTTKREGPNSMTLPPGRRPMPAGKRMPRVITTKKSKGKGDFKVKTLLRNSKKVTAKNRKTGEKRETTVRKIAKYFAQKRNKK